MKKRFLSVLLSLVLVVGLLPTAAFAADSTTVKTIMLGTGGIKDPTKVESGSNKHYLPNSYIYFGVNSTNEDTPIKWRVLNADNANDGTTNGMFLMSEYTLNSEVQFSTKRNNIYQGSNAQTWCQNFAANNKNFSAAEHGVMIGVEKQEAGGNVFNNDYCYPNDTSKSSELKDTDKMFLMSAFELRDYVGNYNNAPGLAATDTSENKKLYYLRTSYYETATNVGSVSTNGSVTSTVVSSKGSVRPAFNLDKSKILFTSDAEGGKSEGNGLTAVSNYNGNEWKLTLKDAGRELTVNEKEVTGYIGGSVKLNFSDATYAEGNNNEYISAMVVNKNSEVLYYGRVQKLSSDSGEVTVALPAALEAGSYTLKVFNEQYNGDRKTDYASDFCDVALTVTAPEAKIGTTYYDTLGKALTAAKDHEGADTIVITSSTIKNVTVGELSAGDSIETYAQTGTGNKITATTDATLNVSQVGLLTVLSGEVNIVNGRTDLVPSATATGKQGVKITNPAGGLITVKVGDDDTVTVFNSCKVTIGETTYTNASSENEMVIDVTTSGVKLTSGAVELDATETICVGNANTAVINSGDAAITVKADDPSSGSATVTVPANGKVTIGSTEYAVGNAETKLVIDASGNVKLNSGSATLDKDEAVNVGKTDTTVTNNGDGQIEVTADGEVTVPKGGQANIGEDKITDVGQDMTFTIGENGKAEFVLGENETVTVNGVKYTGLKTTDGKTVTATEKTTASISENDSISKEDKEAISAVIGETQVQGVTEAVKNSMDALITKSEIKTGAEGVDTIDVDIDVKVELTAAELSSEEQQTMTYTATPVATVTTKKSDGTTSETKTDVAVPNDMLSGDMTVRLPLPEGFELKQIKHTSSDGSVEYFLETSARGAKTFTIEDNCAVFTINKFSTFELSSTKTYVEPSSGGSSSTTYAVSVNKTANGSVSVSPKNASKGTTVTVTTTPDKGWTLETLTVLDKDGKEVDLTIVKLGEKYTFKMPSGKVTVSATFMEDNTMLNYFVDVKASDYFYDAVLWAAKNGITTGVDDLHFAPDASCTRAQIVTFLWRAAGSPEAKSVSSFSDVASDSYYAKAVAWAIENGITNGTGDNKFSPDETCTRAQAVTFLARALDGKATANAEFSDVPADSWYAEAVAWAAENGVTEGIGGGLFGSDSDCTRGQIVTFLFRAYVK